jgi:uncharacterized protein (TIGR02145 family)
MSKILLMLVALFAIGGISSDSLILHDSRDGKDYQTMKVGNLTIMAENLNFNTEGAFCFRNSEDFCDKYGRLYTYKTAMNGSEEEYAQGICPDGWHIPAAEEWVHIIQNLQEGKLTYKEKSPATRLIPGNPLQLKFGGNKSSSNDDIFMVGKKGTYMTSSTKDGQWMVVNFTRLATSHEISVESTQSLLTGISCRCVKND